MKRKYLSYYFFIILSFPSCRKSIKEEYKKGLDIAIAGNYEEAIALFSEIVTKDSSIYEVYQSRGFCYFSLQAYKKAQKDFENAYSISKNPQLQFNLGTVHVNQGNYASALTHLNKFEQDNPDDVNLWLQKALCLSQLKNYSDALPYYEKAQKFFPDSLALSKKIGLCNFQIHNYTGAISALKLYIDTLKDDKGSFEMIAFSHHELGQYQEAKLYFDQMTELGFELEDKTQTLYIKNLLNLGQQMYIMESYVPSLQTFTEVLTLDPLNNEAYFYRGLVQLHYNKGFEACEDFNLAFTNGHLDAISIMKKNCKEYFN
jgi:tetratricopeptide (TPR) repeat protein|tara:strand:- start:2236 stop:3183 length:948 start_codon:yes stop_codon:yes gene_type:complete